MIRPIEQREKVILPFSGQKLDREVIIGRFITAALSAKWSLDEIKEVTDLVEKQLFWKMLETVIKHTEE